MSVYVVMGWSDQGVRTDWLSEVFMDEEDARAWIKTRPGVNGYEVHMRVVR